MEAEVEGLRKHLQSTQESKEQLEKEKIDLEGKLKDLNSQLSAAEVEKKSSENEVARLQEQVRILEGNKEWELAGIDDSLKEIFLSMMELLAQQLPLNNQEQQLQGKKVDLIERLKAELKKESDEALQETREKLAEQEKLIEQLKKEQKQAEDQSKADIKKLQEEKRGQLAEKAQRSSIISLKPSSTKKSPNYSMKSTQSNASKVFSKLFRDKNLEHFLSDRNIDLKKDFPEFKEKHFCHNVLDETIKSLLNQDDGKFKSSKLLELLENNLKESAKKILKDKIKKLDPGKNKEIFIEESAETRMELFLDKIQELRLASSIRDKFLSSDQKMCSRIPGKENKYQLTEKAKKEYTPNSSMSHTNIASIHSLNSRKAVRVGS